ncbi:hypothetical protein [Phenylobacterium sp.]|uniref:hypothetical protein n=1 Tax=Phenylobacterium sp. TaxID=1871053 RepID=UPI0030F3F475
MTLTERPTQRDGIIAVTIALASALILGLILAAISTPADFKARLAEVQQQVDEAGRLARPSRALSSYPADALCTRIPVEQAQILRSDLTQAAAQAQIEVKRMEVGPGGGSTTDDRLATLRVKVEASGSYESALLMLEAMGKLRPQLFADTVDLTPKASTVTLSFSGRAFCSV